MLKYETSKFSKHLLYTSINLNAGKVERMVQQNQYHISAKICNNSQKFYDHYNHLLKVLRLVAKYRPFFPLFSQMPIILNLWILKTWNSKIFQFFPYQHKWLDKLSSRLRIWPDIVSWLAIIWSPDVFFFVWLLFNAPRKNYRTSDSWKYVCVRRPGLPPTLKEKNNIVFFFNSKQVFH